MLIRDARVDDARRIAEIHVRAWQHGYEGLIPAAVLDGLSIPDRERFWSQCLRSGAPTVLVSEVDEQVVGWLALGASRDADAGPSVAEIYAFYVEPAHWRRGAGRLLWSEAERRLAALRFERIALWVLDGNDRGIKFYESVGCTIDPVGVKVFEQEGTQLREVRYVRSLPVGER